MSTRKRGGLQTLLWSGIGAAAVAIVGCTALSAANKDISLEDILRKDVVESTRYVIPASHIDSLSQALPETKEEQVTLFQPERAYPVDTAAYDDTIIEWTDYWNDFFDKRGDERLDPNLVKAMMLHESAFFPDAYAHDPMQIANTGDYALSVLQNGDEFTYTHTDEAFRDLLQEKNHTPRGRHGWDYSNSNMDPETSIKAGILWLFHKAAVYDRQVVERGPMQTYTVESGDIIKTIAAENHTTVESIMAHNPDIDEYALRVGQELQYRESEVHPIIVDWRSWEDAAARYNGGGDPNYVANIAMRRDN